MDEKKSRKKLGTKAMAPKAYISVVPTYTIVALQVYNLLRNNELLLDASGHLCEKDRNRIRYMFILAEQYIAHHCTYS